MGRPLRPPRPEDRLCRPQLQSACGRIGRRAAEGAASLRQVRQHALRRRRPDRAAAEHRTRRRRSRARGRDRSGGYRRAAERGDRLTGYDQEIVEALERIFSADTSIYRQRGFQRRIGFGERPALVNIDLANAWTRPGNPFTCEGMETIIPAVQKLNAAARAKGVPIVYTTTAYNVTDGPNSDMGLWVHKIPVEVLQLGTEAVAIDDRIAPEPGEQVIVKKRASGFHGTYLSGYLNAYGVDTVIVTGVTMAGCVRHTVEDAIAEGFRPIVVREAVGDRVPGVVEWNLFDIDAKFGDVEPLERVLEYLDGIQPFESTRGRTSGVPLA